MTLLIVGLAIFFAVHLATAARGMRADLMARFGEKPYKGVFSLIALAGLVLFIMGFSRADTVELYAVASWGRPLAGVLVLFGFVLMSAADLKGHIKARLRHPMLAGVILWSSAHLSANGDSASVVLFGSFLVYSIVAIVLANRRGPAAEFTPKRLHDGIAVVAGVVIYSVVVYFHGSLFGRALI